MEALRDDRSLCALIKAGLEMLKKKKSISRKIKMYFAAINQMLKGSFR